MPQTLAVAYLLVLGEPAVDSRINDALQPHGQGVQVVVGVGAVGGHQGAQHTVHLLHAVHGHLDGTELL